MNKLKLFVLLLLLGVALPEASAQVSVRRSGSRTETSSAARKDNKKEKSTKKDDNKANTSAAQQRQNRNETDRPASARTEPTRPEQSPKAPAQPATPAGDAATTTPTRRTTPKKQGKQPSALAEGTTQRQQSFDEYQRQEDGYKPWQHVVYRELDLTKEKNASLYFPTEPQDGLTNLFRVILDALCNNRIKGYEYMDGREIFTDKYAVKVQDVLDKFSIYYQQKPGVGNGAQPTYVVDEMDVPSNEVLKYYVKERWEFDQKTSKYGPRILALCPILLRAGDFGGDAVPYPMFWVNYEDIRPMLREHLVMSDGMNNTPRYTMEEYFTLQQYDGDIYKVQNVRGLSLMQQYPNADTLAMMRQKIELELRGFADSIWVHEPTDEEVQASKENARAARRKEKAERNEDRLEALAEKAVKKNRRTKEAVDLTAVEEAIEAKEEEIDQRVEQTGTAHSARRSARRR